jgi:hypothetical protein
MKKGQRTARTGVMHGESMMDKNEKSARCLRRFFICLVLWICLWVYAIKEYAILKQTGVIESFESLLNLQTEPGLYFIICMAASVILGTLVVNNLTLYFRTKRKPEGFHD